MAGSHCLEEVEAPRSSRSSPKVTGLNGQNQDLCLCVFVSVCVCTRTHPSSVEDGACYVPWGYSRGLNLDCLISGFAVDLSVAFP